jgi:hypothetical protein
VFAVNTVLYITVFILELNDGTLLMNLNKIAFNACTIKLYDILKAKNTLVKCAYCVTQYAVCSLVVSF